MKTFRDWLDERYDFPPQAGKDPSVISNAFVCYVDEVVCPAMGPRSCFDSKSGLLLTDYTDVQPQHIEWLNDKHLMRYSEQRHITHTKESVEAYRDSVDHMWGVWAGGSFVGTVAATIDRPNDVVDLGILAPGHGEAAWRKALERLKGHRMIVAGCMEGNAAMRKIRERTMTFHHRRKGWFMYEGRPVDGFYYVKR